MYGMAQEDLGQREGEQFILSIICGITESFRVSLLKKMASSLLLCLTTQVQHAMSKILIQSL